MCRRFQILAIAVGAVSLGAYCDVLAQNDEPAAQAAAEAAEEASTDERKPP